MTSQTTLYRMLIHQHCRVGDIKKSSDNGSSRSPFPELSSKKPSTNFHPHQENSPTLSTFSQKKFLLQSIQELGKGEAGGSSLLLRAFFSENIRQWAQTFPSSCQWKYLACFISSSLQQQCGIMERALFTPGLALSTYPLINVWPSADCYFLCTMTASWS